MTDSNNQTGFFRKFQYMSLTKKILGISVLFFIFLIVWSFSTTGGTKQQVQTATVKKGTIIETLTETGNVQSDGVAVYSTKNGSLEEIYVKNGGKVKKDDDLFKIKVAGTEDEEIIEAPTDGVIANIAFEESSQVVSGGTIVSEKGNASNATPVLLIGKDINKVVKISLGEGDINKVKVGQTAQVSIGAIKDKEFKGKVIRVDNFGTETSGVITYNVYIELQSSDSAIKPFMSATASIETARHDNALLVPFGAVKPYKGGKGAQILETNKSSETIKPVEVKVGIKSSSKIEIIKGLSEGQKVLINTTGNIADNTQKISREGFLKRIWVNHMGSKYDE